MTALNSDTFFYCWQPPAFDCLGSDNFTWMTPIKVHGQRRLFDSGGGSKGDLVEFTNFNGTNDTMQDPAGEAEAWAEFTMDEWDAWYALHVAAGGGPVPFTCLAQNLGLYDYDGPSGLYVNEPPNIMPLPDPQQTEAQMTLNLAYWSAWTEAAYAAIVARKGIPPYAWLDTEGMRRPGGGHAWYVADPQTADDIDRTETHALWYYRLCRGFCFGLNRGCGGSPPLWGNYAGWIMQSTAQPSSYKLFHTENNDRLESSGQLVTGKPMLPWVLGPRLVDFGIDVYGSSPLTSASVEVTGTSLILRDNLVPTTTITFAAEPTLAEMIVAINAIPNWTAALLGDADETRDTASTNLVVLVETSCLGSSNEVTLDAGFMQSPDFTLGWSKDRIDIYRHDTYGLMDNPNDPIQVFIYWAEEAQHVEEIWNQLVDPAEGWLVD